MVEAKKEMLSIEKLKDIKISEYRKEEQKENELFIEEFISSRKLWTKTNYRTGEYEMMCIFA